MQDGGQRKFRHLAAEVPVGSRHGNVGCEPGGENHAIHAGAPAMHPLETRQQANPFLQHPPGQEDLGRDGPRRKLIGLAHAVEREPGKAGAERRQELLQVPVDDEDFGRAHEARGAAPAGPSRSRRRALKS